jgi:hypothetical protein
VAPDYRQVGSHYSAVLSPSLNVLRSQRTLVALQYPPHVVAIACLYLAALLSTFEQSETQTSPGCRSDHEIAAMLGDYGPWENKFQAQVDDLEGEVWKLIFRSLFAQ